MLKVTKTDITVLHCAQTHRSTMMVSQLAVSSKAQIAYLCQGELLKGKTKNTASGYEHINSAFDKMKWRAIYYINENKKTLP